MRICVVSDYTLYCFHPNFCPAVGVWESRGGEAMMDAPFLQE